MRIPLLNLQAQYTAIRDEIETAISSVLESSHFILGEEVSKLEEEVASFCGTRFAVGVASGTDALLLSLKAFGIGPGDEVITTPYTFFATASSVSRAGAKPVFIDIDPETYNLDTRKLEEYLKAQTSSRLKAVIPVHLYGQCAEMDTVLELARTYNLKVIEDAAQAIGAEYKNRKTGSMGDAGAFSFFPSKNLGGYGDGGMVVTDAQETAERIKILRNQGGMQKYFYSVIGYNSRLDSLQAAILRVKLKYLKEWNRLRREHALTYNRFFADNNNIVTPYTEPRNVHIYNQYTLRVKKRDELEKHLKLKGIGCALYYPLPLHLQECYKDLGYKEGDFPESEKASKETISIPVYPELTTEQQETVAGEIKEFYDKKTL